WPRFVPHLAQIDLAPVADPSSPVMLRQDTRVWGFGFTATTQRWLDSDQHILWDRLAPGAHSDRQALSGFLQGRDLGDGRSLLRFQSRVALGSSMPRSLESWLVQRGAPDALEAFAAEIERRQHASAAGRA